MTSPTTNSPEPPPSRRAGPAKTAALMALTALAGALALTAGGCIRSRVHILSEPAGAEVIWRGQPYGATPVTIPFIWYWYYDIALEKPGYERLEVTERFRTPPWFLMPLDLFMEMIPIPIPDNRERSYVLKKKSTGLLELEPTATPPPAAPAGR